MFVVVEIAGHQYMVKPNDVLKVNKLDLEAGQKFVTERVLLTSDNDGKDVVVGQPYVDGRKVEAEVLNHGRGEKIRVFKMKAKKRYARTQGHRQDFTELKILSV
jgi:large subunit ribosomal protein L21